MVDAETAARESMKGNLNVIQQRVKDEVEVRKRLEKERNALRQGTAEDTETESDKRAQVTTLHFGRKAGTYFSLSLDEITSLAMRSGHVVDGLVVNGDLLFGGTGGKLSRALHLKGDNNFITGFSVLQGRYIFELALVHSTGSWIFAGGPSTIVCAQHILSVSFAFPYYFLIYHQRKWLIQRQRSQAWSS